MTFVGLVHLNLDDGNQSLFGGMGLILQYSWDLPAVNFVLGNWHYFTEKVTKDSDFESFIGYRESLLPTPNLRS